VQTMRERGQSFTAVFADTDIKAVGVIRALHDMGLRVPADVSVLGYDDNPMADVIQPALTTIHTPMYEMGKAAVKMLLDRIDRNNRDRPGMTLSSNLMIRDSCGPVP